MNVTAETFEQHRPLMFSIAYRMLGTISDAEDMLQEAYLRWRNVNHADVKSPKSFLAATVTRLCMDHLRSARVRREQYVGPWLPEPLLEGPGHAAGDDASLAESLSMAFLMMLEQLSPTERAVFLLHDIFGFEFAEVSRMIGKTAANCRQLGSRARQHLVESGPRFEHDPKKAEQLAEEFLAACRSGDTGRLIGLLAEDATLYSDGGGKVPAAQRPIQGADPVARFLIGVTKKAPPDLQVEAALVNGQPGLVIYQQGVPIRVFSLEYMCRKLRTICVVGNPDKLQHLAGGASRQGDSKRTNR